MSVILSRPWLDLFRTISSQSCPCYPSELETSQSPGLLSLPNEVLFSIFCRLEPEQLSVLAQTNTQLLEHAYDPRHWRRIALETWSHETQEMLKKELLVYKSWRKLCTLRPHLRTNGIYVLRHQFTKTASKTVGAEPQAPVFLVTYYRYLRFYTDGTVIGLVTPEAPHLAMRRVHRHWLPAPGERDKVGPTVGRYDFDERAMRIIISLPMHHVRFPGMRPGIMFMHMRLSSTTPGSCDRLFVTDHYAVMDQEGEPHVSFPAHELNNKPFRLIPIWGFRMAMSREFPSDDEHQLAKWFELKKNNRANPDRGA